VREVYAAVATEPLRTELRTFPVPEVGPEDGLLRVEACGLCGTDWEYYTRQRGANLGPMILGHEIVGTVLAVGEQASRRWGVRPGDRVAVEEFLPCGTCTFCRTGRPALCDATDSRSAGPFLRYGATPVDVPPALWGGFSEVLYLHPRALVHRLPQGLSPDLATLFVPVSNGIRWVRRDGQLPPGGTAVVIGPGAHGLGCVAAAVEAGASQVFAVGRSASPRLEAARALGAVALEADRVDVVEAVRDATGGRMADLVVDLAPGDAHGLQTALALAAKGGVVLFAATKHGQAAAETVAEPIVRKGLVVKGVRGRDFEAVEEALALLASHRLPLDRLRTHRFSLQDTDRALRVQGARLDPSAIHVAVVP
jgi:threonine dehydrogenase-like Zn-dependent dehydrogenase